MTNEGYHLVKVRTFRTVDKNLKKSRGPNLKGNAFANFGNSSGTNKTKKREKSEKIILNLVYFL